MRPRCLAWAGGLLLLLGAALPGGADEKADALLKQAREATSRLKTLHADLDLTSRGTRYTGTVALQRPNMARIELKDVMTIVSDGKFLLNYQPRVNQYTKSDSHPQGHNIRALWALPVTAFFNPAGLGMAPSGATRKYAGQQTVDGATYEVVQIDAPGERQVTIQLFFSPEDRLLHRSVQTSKSADLEVINTAVLRNVRKDVPVEADLFRYTPPATARLYERPDYMKSLLAVGQPAPDFDLAQPGGSRLVLSSVLPQKKATLLNFWFYN